MVGRAGVVNHSVRRLDNTRWLNEDIIEVKTGSGRSFNRGELYMIIIFWPTINDFEHRNAKYHGQLILLNWNHILSIWLAALPNYPAIPIFSNCCRAY